MILRRLALVLLLPFASPALAETAQPPETSTVTEAFKTAFAESCSWAIEGNMGDLEPEVYDLHYRGGWQEAAEPDLPMRVYEFHCNAGAYNFISVYYSWDEIGGLGPIAFVEPELDIQYLDIAEDTDDIALKSITVTGYSATFELTNPDFDAATGSITSSAKWRGIGDAGAVGRYEMKEGSYVLKTFDVDPTYDGEDNMIRTVDASKPINVPLVVLDDTSYDETTTEDGETAE